MENVREVLKQKYHELLQRGIDPVSIKIKLSKMRETRDGLAELSHKLYAIKACKNNGKSTAALYCILNNIDIDDIPTCKYCDAKVRFIGMEEGFNAVCSSISCSRKHALNADLTSDNEKASFLEKFKTLVHTEADIQSFINNATPIDKKVLKSLTSFLDAHYNEIRSGVRIYCILNNIDSVDKIPRCSECGKLAGLARTCFSNTCSDIACRNRNKSLIAKQQASAIKNYGSFSNAYSNKNTIVSKYGVDNVSKLDSVKEKKIQTSLERYGTEYPWQTITSKRKKNSNTSTEIWC